MFDPRWADAISSIESGGNYGILGPVTKKGDRAYGRYQVMGSNVGPWTREVLGKAMTPQEFVNNPAAQDAVFQAKFGQAVSKYGNPQDAASVWFTGKPLAQGANRSDVLGTTGQAYVDKFSKALGQPALTTVAQNTVQPQQAPQQAAQPTQSSAPLGLPFSAQPMSQMAQQPIEQTPFNLVRPQTPRRVNVTGLLQLLQNAPPSVRGLLAQG
jgi:hypothetical protein